MEVSALIVSILSLVLSTIATIISLIIANKPYYKKLCLSETFVARDDQFGLSISNIGRTVVYIDLIELVEKKSGDVLGQKRLESGAKDTLFAIRPGEIKYITIDLYTQNSYRGVADPNKYLELRIWEKNGRKSIYKDFLAVG